MKVLVTQYIPEPGIELLKEKFEVKILSESGVPLKEEIIENVKDKDGVLCLLTDKITRDVLASANRAKVFSNYAVGFDNIDVPCATELGIVVTNTPGVLTDTTAELAWALLFSIARRIPMADKWTREGKFKSWDPLLFLGTDLKDKTLGVIGAGRIGTAFALKSKGFGMKVIYYDTVSNEHIERELNAELVSLEYLLLNSDFISIHVPLTQTTYHLIGEKELKKMKKTAYLINTARGPVVDENALVKALKEKWIQGAALDVYEKEPEIHPGLFELDNVVMVPHIGSATRETREKMAIMAANNLIDVLENRKPSCLVNPEVWEKRRK